MSRRRQSQRGYSLAEALIAVALLAGLASVLTPALFGAMRASTKVLALGAEQEALRTADEALDRIFSNTVILAAEPADLYLSGTAKEIRLVSLAGPRAVARRFALTVEDGALAGEIAPLEDDAGAVRKTLLLSAGAVEFSYYGARSDREAPSWGPGWNGARPPQIVRLEIIRNGNPITFEYGLTARGFLHCEFDPVSRRCRV